MFRRSKWALAAAWVMLAVCLLIWISGYFFEVYIAYYWHRADGNVRQESVSFWNGEMMYISAMGPANLGAPQGFNGQIRWNLAPHFVLRASHLGFMSGLDHISVATGGQLYGLITIPWWFLSLFPASVIAWRFWVNLQKRAAMAKNLCVNCGYDLRETPKYCPECGMIPPKTTVLHG